MSGLPEFGGWRKLTSTDLLDHPPDHIDVYAGVDGPEVAVSGLPDGEVAIPFWRGENITGDAERFREAGDGSLLVGLVREKIGGVFVYPRVHTLYVVTGFVDHGDGIVDAEYRSVIEGHVNQTRHNHRHLVDDPDADVVFRLFAAAE